MMNISIIIAAKNEQKNIPFLINSLQKLDYPSENFEVIIVDDNSTDDTYQISKELTESLNNYKIIKAVNKIFQGKRGALDLGIKYSKNDYILITDADCFPERNWLKEYANKFEKGFDFLFGIAPFLKENNIVNKISRYEDLRTHIQIFYFSKIGHPFSCAARNIGFSKKAFNKIGGYKNTTQTLSGDDDLLLREAVRHNLKIGTVEAKESFVYSRTKLKFREYFRQRARHLSTSNYYLPKQKLMLGIYHITNMVCLFSILFFFVSKLVLIPFVIKLLFDLIIVIKNQKKYGYYFNIFEMIYLSFVYEIFLIVHYIYGSVSKPHWN